MRNLWAAVVCSEGFRGQGSGNPRPSIPPFSRETTLATGTSAAAPVNGPSRLAAVKQRSLSAPPCGRPAFNPNPWDPAKGCNFEFSLVLVSFFLNLYFECQLPGAAANLVGARSVWQAQVGTLSLSPEIIY